MSICLYTHSACLDHDPGIGHPENADRLSNILAALENSAIADSVSVMDAPQGTDEQVLLAHTQSHLDHVKATAPVSGSASLDADTTMSPASLDAALRGVGAACQGVDALMAGNPEAVFCATRPPGHHATPDRAMGFCIFNQVAIAALYAQQQYQLERVAIVDFDVHHGNGTQDIMQGREGLFYISTHQSPLYPGTGQEAENLNFNILNIPLHGGTGHGTYIQVFEEMVISALNAWQPQLLLVSAGFDAHKADPLAGMALTDETYHWLGMQLQAQAGKHCDGKLLSVLEGGYNLKVLPGSVLSWLGGLLGREF